MTQKIFGIAKNISSPPARDLAILTQEYNYRRGRIVAWAATTRPVSICQNKFWSWVPPENVLLFIKNAPEISQNCP